MNRRAALFRRWVRPARIGWALTGVGALVLILLSQLADPASARESTRTVATMAFATAQLGLVIVALAVFRQLYAHAGRVGRRRQGAGRLR